MTYKGKRLPLNGDKPVKQSEQDRLDEQWASFVDPSTAAEEDARAEEREQERNGIWEAWGWTPPKPERARWPERDPNAPLDFAARVEDIRRTEELQAEVKELMERRGY